MKHHISHIKKIHISSISKGDKFLHNEANNLGGYLTYTAVSDAYESDGEWIVEVQSGTATVRHIHSSQYVDGMVHLLVTASQEHSSATDVSWHTFEMAHHIHDNYVLSGIPNAFNDKTSWWLSKHDCTVAMYCFSTSGSEQNQKKEAEYQLQHIDSYIRAFEYRAFSMDAQAK